MRVCMLSGGPSGDGVMDDAEHFASNRAKLRFELGLLHPSTGRSSQVDPVAQQPVLPDGAGSVRGGLGCVDGRRPGAGLVSGSAGPAELPPALLDVAARHGLHSAVLVWLNELGGRTFRLSGPDGESFVKWLPDHPEFDVRAEAARLIWARDYVPVPEVLGYGYAADSSWLWTRGLPGRSAVDPRWQDQPATAARAIGVGLRVLHDRLPVEDCPFGWSVPDRLAALGSPRPDLVKAAPAVAQLVVCHGDPCAPNTLLADDGSYAGTVDLSALGTADRWADLAVATYSLSWNFAGSWEDELLEAYGVERDEQRLRYYRELWDAT